MSRKIASTIMVSLLILFIVPALAFGIGVSLDLSTNYAEAGDRVTASGQADPNSWVSIKVLDSSQNIVFYNAVKSGEDGKYTDTLIIPDLAEGVLNVVAGSGENVVSQLLTIGSPTNLVSLKLSSNKADTGDKIMASGTADPNSWVSIKVIDREGAIVFFDAVKASGNGTYNCTFTVPDVFVGTVLEVIAGYGSNVARQTLTINEQGSDSDSGGGGGSSVSKEVSSTNGSASVSPRHGGSISLGSDAGVEIPAGALKGSSTVKVKVKKVTSAPDVPAGSRLASDVFNFSAGSKKDYTFAKSVTVKLKFNPSLLKANEVPAIHYHDDSQSKWISIGGTVSGSTISAQVKHFSKFAVLATLKDLSDIEGNWAAADINKMYAAGVIGGYPDGTFRPNNQITRAEFVTALVKAFQLEAQSDRVFGDTAEHWARDYISIATASEIAKGYSDSSFGPDDAITREQMAVMIVNAAKSGNVTTGQTFTDQEQISSWASDAIDITSTEGIITGYPDKSFNPQGNATRAEAVTVISRALEK